MDAQPQVRNLGTRSAAKVLKITAQRVCQIAQSGRIGEMMDGRWMFSRAELEAFAKVDRPPGNKRGVNRRAYAKAMGKG
jgi:hypothetical protein